MIETLQNAFSSGLELWSRGGWAMFPLAANALILYAIAAQIRISLWGKSLSELPRHPDGATARDYIEGRGIDLPHPATLDEGTAAFDELRLQELPPIDRNLRFMKAAMSAAPLWGLLGTVTGMLKTFGGLSKGGGDETMGTISKGISEALITTQTGLMIAIPGYFFFYYLAGQRERFAAKLARLETAATQSIIHAN